MLTSKFITVVLDCCAHAKVPCEVKGNQVNIKLTEEQRDIA